MLKVEELFERIELFSNNNNESLKLFVETIYQSF